jgi:hypothetical protein
MEFTQMALEEISAKLTGGEPITIKFELDDTLDGAVKHYGEEVVFSRYQSALIIDLQSKMRTMIKAGKTEADIQAEADIWQPGVKSKGKSPAEKARDLFGRLSAEEREALLSEFGLV